EEPKQEDKCPKCKGPKKQFEFSCSDKVCFDCLVSFFISSNLKNLSLNEVKFNCPICNEGTLIIPIDEWRDILNEENQKQEEKNRYMQIKNQIPKKKCFNHKDQDVVGYCANCKLWLCNECKKLFHNLYHPDHQFSLTEDPNIFCDSHPESIAEYFCITCQKNICKQCITENGDKLKKHTQHRYMTKTEYQEKTLKNNGEKSLNYQTYDEFEEYTNRYVEEFNQRLESDFITKQKKIKEMIQKLQGLEMEYQHQTENFQIKMNQIFTIIKETYFYYFSCPDENKQKINFQSSLTNISLVSKRKADLDELFCGLLTQMEEFEKKENPEDNPEIISTLNFQLVWNNNSLKKTASLNPGEKVKNPKFGEKDYKGPEYIIVRPQNEAITKILLLNDPDLFLTASVDGSLGLWDLQDLKGEPTILKAHSASIWSLFQDDEFNIYSGSADKTIKVWNSPIEEEAKPIATLKGHKGTIYVIHMTKDKKLLSGSDDRTIKFWGPSGQNKYSCLRTVDMKATTTCIGNLVDNFIVTAGDDNLVKLIDLKNMKIKGQLKGHDCSIWSMAVFTDNVHLATGSSDNSIKVWNLNTLKCEYSLKGHSNTVCVIRILKNGMLASASWDKTIKIWNLSTKMAVCTIENAHNGNIYDLVETNDGRFITCSEDKEINIWESK
ncbi:MAG: hypothetical protein MJ252_26350, partial [archaeon]|nr:hypothetical protein [archaeon]